jgi:4'-phosphopantetheinyl transferase
MQEYVAHAYVLDIVELECSQIAERSIAQLNAECKLRLGRMRSEKRKRQFILARYLLSECLFQLTNSYYSIGYFETGQPYIEDSDFHCSISHSENFIAIAFSNEAPIGIDIEQHRFRDFYPIVTTYFHRQEIAIYQDLLKAEQMNWFYENWTMKEAKAKATGDGINQINLGELCTTSSLMSHQTDEYSLACIHHGVCALELFKARLLVASPWLQARPIK